MMDDFTLVISFTEETTVQFNVRIGDKPPVISNVERCAVRKQVFYNESWIRETLLVDIADFDKRYEMANEISAFTYFLFHVIGASQLVYSTRDGEYTKAGTASSKILTHEETGKQVLCNFYEDVVVIDRPPYPSPVTDVEHIEKAFSFHSTKHTVNPLAFSVDNLINKSDMVVFVGDTDHRVKQTFEKFNSLNNDHCVIRYTDDYEKHVLSLEVEDDEEKTFRCVLVVDNTDFTDVAIEIIEMKHEKIAAVVFDSAGYDDDGTLELLSLCRAKNILCVRKIQRHGWFNLGVIDVSEQTSECHYSGNGVITMTDDTVVPEYSYVVYIDPRMSQIAKLVIGLEMAAEVWAITLVHDARDDLVANHYDYKFFPVFQTEGFFRLCQMNKKHTIHSVLTVVTPFPAIAAMLFDSGIFVTCDVDVALEYNEKINALFNKEIKKQRLKHVEKVVGDKANTYKYVTDIERKIVSVNNEILSTVAKQT